MNDDRSGGAAPAGDTKTVQPGAAGNKTGGWQMPEPKFQQTSGYLPQGYLEKAGLDGTAGSAQSSTTASPDIEVPATAGVDVGPQPDLSEVIAGPPAVAAANTTPVNQRSTAARVVLVLLGVVGMIVFIAAFLAAVWYLFLRPANGGSPF